MRISSRRSSLTPWPVSAPTGGVTSWSSAPTELATGCTPPRRLRPGNGSAAARSNRTRWSPGGMRRRTGQRGSSAGSNSTAYPLNDEVLVTWSSDPAQWSPINHSCDPNAWLEGLDLVARRSIEPGEEITVEYATFIAGTGASFDCHCGADDCRGTVTPQDWQLPEIRRRYGRALLGLHRRQVGQPGRPRLIALGRAARRGRVVPRVEPGRAAIRAGRPDRAPLRGRCRSPRSCPVHVGHGHLVVRVRARRHRGHLAARDHRLGHGCAPRRPDEQPRRSLRPRADRRGRRAAPRDLRCWRSR